MSPTLIVLASILAFFAIVLITFMMTKNARQKKHDPNAHVNQGTKHQKKKKRR